MRSSSFEPNGLPHLGEVQDNDVPNVKLVESKASFPVHVIHLRVTSVREKQENRRIGCSPILH
jgi:hypothetical protein